ncbi:hypothetical protein PFISCL1PPCAC_5972, partial [Pristionchus fissidentatus]
GVEVCSLLSLMFRYLIIVSLPLIHAAISPTEKPCIDLAACATKHCLNKKSIVKKIENSTSLETFEKIVTSFDMICITTKCTASCSLCKSCHYAIEQISSFISGSSNGGVCPILEKCISGCIKGEDIKQILKCVDADCNVHCYDGSCSSCKALSRRIFTRFCRETDVIKMPQFADFNGESCPVVFDRLSDEFVKARRH